MNDYKQYSNEFRFCNCAGCNRLLTGLSCRHLWRKGHPPLVAGRVADRPYCPECFTIVSQYVRPTQRRSG